MQIYSRGVKFVRKTNGYARKRLYICHRASPTRPAPAESPRVVTQQGYAVVAVRCKVLALLSFLRVRVVVFLSST